MNEKAVAVARDVLAHLNSLHLVQGYYVRGKNIAELPNLEGDARQHLDLLQNKCRVCLLGACLLSKIRVYDEIDIDEMRDTWDHREVYLDDEQTHRLLKKIFSREQMDIMEAAFEGITGLADYCTDQELLARAVTFGSQYKDITERVRAVMENIIQNNGTFIPQVEVPA